MVSVLKSKKGGIPAVNEIVMTFLRVTPKPILFLIFILLVTTIATFVIPSMLNLFGYECVQVGEDDIELFQVPMNSLAQKTLADARQGVRGFFGLEDYTLPEDPFPDGDKRFLRVSAECFIEAEINGVSSVGYSSACVDCNKSGLFRYWGSVCTTDGFYDPDLVTKNWIGTANFCYKCAPPNPYYYNHSFCFDQDQCFFRIEPEFEDDVDSIISSGFKANYYYQNILKLGGVKRVQDETEFVNIQCEDVDQPQLYFFSIQIFNREMWIFLYVSYFLIMFASLWYHMTLK